MQASIHPTGKTDPSNSAAAHQADWHQAPDRGHTGTVIAHGTLIPGRHSEADLPICDTCAEK